MAILSSRTLITSVGVFNLICAYFLLTTPTVIASHNLVTVLSAAVNLPLSNDFRVATDAVALLAGVLALLALADVTAVSMREEVAALYWQSQTPIRLLFFFVLTAYSYSRRPGGIWVGRAESLSLADMVQGAQGGLGSGIVFAWAFTQMMSWFWIFIVLRDERREREVVEARKSQ